MRRDAVAGACARTFEKRRACGQARCSLALSHDVLAPYETLLRTANEAMRLCGRAGWLRRGSRDSLDNRLGLAAQALAQGRVELRLRPPAKQVCHCTSDRGTVAVKGVWNEAVSEVVAAGKLGLGFMQAPQNLSFSHIRLRKRR